VSVSFLTIPLIYHLLQSLPSTHPDPIYDPAFQNPVAAPQPLLDLTLLFSPLSLTPPPFPPLSFPTSYSSPSQVPPIEITATSLQPHFHPYFSFNFSPLECFQLTLPSYYPLPHTASMYCTARDPRLKAPTSKGKRTRTHKALRPLRTKQTHAASNTKPSQPHPLPFLQLHLAKSNSHSLKRKPSPVTARSGRINFSKDNFVLYPTTYRVRCFVFGIACLMQM
jgi:hypothetical protein